MYLLCLVTYLLLNGFSTIQVLPIKRATTPNTTPRFAFPRSEKKKPGLDGDPSDLHCQTNDLHISIAPVEAILISALCSERNGRCLDRRSDGTARIQSLDRLGLPTWVPSSAVTVL